MAVIDEFNALWEEKEEREGVIAARASMENLTNVMLEELDRFAAIKANNDFSTIPTASKQALLRWETAYKDVKTLLLADQEIVDIYNWRP